MRHLRLPRPRYVLAVIFVAVGLALAAVGIAGLVQSTTKAADQLALGTDLTGKPFVLDVGPEQKSHIEQADARPGGNGRFEIPAVSLDVSLGALNEVGGTITPPGATSAYLVRNRGVTPQQSQSGTVYVVMHSVYGGIGPGNYLVDSSRQSSKVPAGATITVDGINYQVDASWLADKAQLPHDSRVWTGSPGRLVVVTCLIQADGTSTENFILQAHRIP